MPESRSDRRHVYGLVVLIISCILSINPYFLLLTLPMCGVGITLICSSRLPAGAKAVLCVLPFLLPISVYLAWLW